MINKKINLKENAWQCNNCDFKHKLKDCAQNHVEEKHRPQGFPNYTCNKCFAVNPTWFEFVKHAVKFHKSDIQEMQENPRFTRTAHLEEGSEWDIILLQGISKNWQNNNWICNVCNYTHPKREHCLSDVETEHKPPGFPGYKCKKCEFYKQFKS